MFEEDHLSNEYRFRKKDGSYCWVNDELQVLRDSAGNPIEVVGAWSDVTARKQLGEADIHGMNGISEAVRQVRGTSVNQVEGDGPVLVTAGTGVPTSGLILGPD